MKELELYSTLKDLFKPTTHSHNVKKLEKKNKLLLSQTTTMKISAFALALAAAPAAFPGLSVAAFGPAPADRSSAASMIRSSTTNHRSSSSLFVATNIAPSTSTTVRPPIIVFNEDEGGNAMMEPSVTREASVEPLAIDDLPFGVKITGADKLRAEGLTGKGVRVAVIDSGVDAEHSGFHEQVKQQVWFRHGSSLSPLSEDFHELFHGTHVAGTIHMMAPEAEIYDYRCFGAEGVGVDTAIERSIYQAIDDGCDIINMSLGGPYANLRIQRAVRYAHWKDVIMIVAAGNEGDNDPLTNELGYPAMNPEVVSVAAVSKRDNLPVARFSNTNAQVDYAGIGVNVQSFKPDGGVQQLSGTSMATPHVCGLVTALLTKDGPYSDLIKDDESLRKLLNEKFVVDIGVTGPDNATGLGFLTYLNEKEYETVWNATPDSEK